MSCQLRKSGWGGRRCFPFPPPYSSLNPTPTPSNFFLSLPKLLPNLNQRHCTHLIKMFLLAKIHQPCIYMKSYFYAPFKFLLDFLSFLNARCVVCWSFTSGGRLSFISCCLIFRARPLNPFEKERGDKNIIKLPGDGAVWVSYLYCFFEDMADVVFMLKRGIYIGCMVE